MRGDWLIYCSILKFFPKAFRQKNFNFKEVNFLLDLTSPPQFSIYRQKLYEPETAQKIYSLLKPGDVFIDIGANFGFFSLLACKKMKNSGLVIAIEPSPSAFIDTEGAELPILYGAKKLLSQQKPVIILEVGDNRRKFNYKSQDIYNFMRIRGYQKSQMLDGRQILFSQ